MAHDNLLKTGGDIAFLAVAFSTTKRGAELTNTLIRRVLRLPNKSGLLFNFQWGKTLRDGADHLISVPDDEKYVAVCPVRAVEKWIAVGQAAGWDMTSGYLFFECITHLAKTTIDPNFVALTADVLRILLENI